MNRLSIGLFLAQCVVLMTLIFFVSQLPAVEQFDLKQCQQLQRELEKNRQQQRLIRIIQLGLPRDA